MAEQASQESPPAAPQKGAGLVAKARAHKVATTIIAIAGFLGLGGIFGQWAVERIGDLIEGDSPPAGFNELHDAWQDTANLNERLLAAGGEANKQLEEGMSNTGRYIPPELEDDLEDLRGVRRDASVLAGRVRATTTDMTGPRADLVRLVILVRDTAHRVEDGAKEAYVRHGGEPIYGGSGDFAPVFSNELRADASEQDGLVRQVAAGLKPTALRFERSIPELRGWNRLVYPHAESDRPNY